MLITGLPISDYWLEEATVPKGYFPIVPIKFYIADADTTDSPHMLDVPNSPFVNLGSKTTRLSLIFATIAALAGVTVPAVWFLYRRHRPKKNNDGK